MQFWHIFYILPLCASYTLAHNTSNDINNNDFTRENDSENPTTVNTILATTESYRRPRWQQLDLENNVASEQVVADYEHEEANLSDHDDVSETKVTNQPKYIDYSNGYYNFLINEGSYKFWAVFQLVTAAILIYSGFAALYYAKINPQIPEDYDDYALRRRRRYANWNGPPVERSFFGFRPETFQRIIDAISEDLH